MAGEEHLKNLKNFLWKYGGGMDRVDSFRVSESDLSKVRVVFCDHWFSFPDWMPKLC